MLLAGFDLIAMHSYWSFFAVCFDLLVVGRSGVDRIFYLLPEALADLSWSFLFRGGFDPRGPSTAHGCPA